MAQRNITEDGKYYVSTSSSQQNWETKVFMIDKDGKMLFDVALEEKNYSNEHEADVGHKKVLAKWCGRIDAEEELGIGEGGY